MSFVLLIMTYQRQELYSPGKLKFISHQQFKMISFIVLNQDLQYLDQEACESFANHNLMIR